MTNQDQYEQILGIYEKRYENPLIWNDTDHIPVGVRLQIEVMEAEARAFDALRDVLTILHEVPRADRGKLGFLIDEYITEVIIEKERLETEWKMKTREPDPETIKTAWHMVAYPRIHNALPILIQNGYIENAGDYFNWTGKQSLLADLFRNMGGQNKDISKYFRINHETIKPASLKAQIAKGNSEYFYKLQAILPEI